MLVGVHEDGLPPGEPQHDIVYGRILILACSECRSSEVEIYNHDCFDHEDVFDRYDWYVLGSAVTGQLASLLAACPAPLSTACGCAMHGALRASCLLLRSSSGPGNRVHPGRLDVTAGLPRISS